MFKITNRLNQPLVVNRGPAKVLHLLPTSAAVITEEELQMPQVQGLLAAGALVAEALKGRRARRKDDERTARKKEN